MLNCHALVLTLAVLTCAAISAADAPTNIVFILIDDMGWTDVHCFGSKVYETPHIDALAAQGMKFTNAYAACNVCSPTRASILTGRYPARLHITDWIPGHVAAKDNLVEKLPEKAKELHQRLIDYRKEMGAQMPTMK